MVKHTHAIRRQQPTNFLSVFDHFMGLPLRELMLAEKTQVPTNLIKTSTCFSEFLKNNQMTESNDFWTTFKFIEAAFVMNCIKDW